MKGANAPDFELNDQDRNPWRLSDQLGEVVVLLFYPGDDTPVCTKQLCSVRDRWKDYQDTGATVVGISTDSADSHLDFKKKHDLPLTLLADVGGKVSKSYGASSWIPGKSARAVVVINREGKIAHHGVLSLSVFRPDDDEVIQSIKDAS